jgi:hypothetical protein
MQEFDSIQYIKIFISRTENISSKQLKNFIFQKALNGWQKMKMT